MDETKAWSNENNLDLTNEEMCTWKDNNERIQIEGVSSSKPIKGNHSVTTGRLWKYFQTWLRTSVASSFTSNDENGSIRQHPGSRIPSSSLSDSVFKKLMIVLFYNSIVLTDLKTQDLIVFFPIVGTIDSRRTIGRI